MRLRTFGGLWIEGGASESPGPRPLALLALVAAAGGRGVSRERVVGILWPETGEEQARHTLRQTLYRLKQETGADWIVSTPELRLGPSVSSDIGELLDAVRGADLERVAALYSGKFLDGFYLPGAPDFERWLEEERARVHQLVLRALEQLAAQADAAQRRPSALTLWHRLTELDPLSARYAVGHMRALAAVDDRSGALVRAKLYADAVQRELNAKPDPAVTQLEAALRAPDPSPRRVPPPAAEPPPPEVPRAGGTATQEPAGRQSGTRRARWLVPAVGLGIVALGLAVRGVWSRSSTPPPFLAVGEIRVDGSPDSTSLGRIVRDMLATSLGGIDGLEVAANSRLVELLPRGSDTTAGIAAMLNDAARRAGATEVIEGELVKEPEGFVFQLRRVGLSRGVVRKGYVVRAADRYALVDSATAAIARDFSLVPPSVAVAQVRTSSPGAYALYDEGLRAYFGYDGPAAYRLMSAALARDSTFAMAAWYVWWLSRNMSMPESVTTPALQRIQRLAPRTIERERLLIQASVAEVAAPLLDAVAIAETLTVKYPTDPDGQLQLAAAREKQGDWAAAVAAYERAFALDSVAGALAGPYCRVCVTLGLMSRAYLWWDSAGAAERVTRKLIALRPDESQAWGHLVEILARQERRTEAEAVFLRQAGLSSAAMRSGLLDRDLLRWGRYQEADRVLTEELRSRSRDTREDAKWLLLLSLRDQGRLREAQGLIQRWQIPDSANLVAEPGSSPVDLALLGVESGRPALTIRAHRENVASSARWTLPPALRARHVAWNLVLAGTAHHEAGDTAIVRRLVDSLENIGRNSNWARDTRLHFVLRGLLFQREGKQGDAVEAFRRSLYSLTDGYTRANYLLAQSLLQLGRGSEAIPVLQPAIRGGVDGSNSYVSRTELHEALAQAFEQTGQRDSALAHWRAVESGWRRADPQFRDRYQHAKLKSGL